jgi:hypothetical protein
VTDTGSDDSQETAIASSLTDTRLSARPRASEVSRPWQSFPVLDPFFDFFEEDYHEHEQPAPSADDLTQIPVNTASSPLYISLVPVPDTEITQTDLPYIRYFLSEMSNTLPYANIFPSSIYGIFSSSIHHPALRYSVLSISALCCDKKSHQGKRRALEHLAKSLKLLQRSLWSVEVDECVANAIFLLAYFNLLAGDKISARKHLRGLSMVLDRIQQSHLVNNGGVLSPYAISPLTMLIWRMAIRVDFIIAITSAQRPVFPAYTHLIFR